MYVFFDKSRTKARDFNHFVGIFPANQKEIVQFDTNCTISLKTMKTIYFFAGMISTSSISKQSVAPPGMFCVPWSP